MLNEIKTQGGKVTLYFEEPKNQYSYALICTDIDVDDDVRWQIVVLSTSRNEKNMLYL